MFPKGKVLSYMLVCTVNVQTKKFIYHLHSKKAFSKIFENEENAAFPFSPKSSKENFILLYKKF